MREKLMLLGFLAHDARGAPAWVCHHTLRMRFRIPCANVGPPFLRRERQAQWFRDLRCCQAIFVLGWTKTSTLRRPDQVRDSAPQVGRLPTPGAMVTCTGDVTGLRQRRPIAHSPLTISSSAPGTRRGRP